MKNFQSLIWPAATFLLLVGVLIYQQNLYAKAEVDDGYFNEIADKIRGLPMSQGDWIGKSSEVPQSAVELLNANEVAAIRFSHLVTGESVEVLLVHCADARDLIGHYPPVCYPAHGWTSKSSAPMTLTHSGRPEESGDTPPGAEGGGDNQQVSELPCTYYQFERVDEGYSHTMSVMNFMVLPDGRIGPSMEIVNNAASDLTKRGKGVLQVQILFRDPMMSDKRRLEIADEFLAYMQPVFSAVWEAEEK